jgi:hypothetical protein
MHEDDRAPFAAATDEVAQPAAADVGEPFVEPRD